MPSKRKKTIEARKAKKKGDMERTRKPENRDQKTARLENVFFGKISKGKWVNK